jgi:hypothetical protein
MRGFIEKNDNNKKSIEEKTGILFVFIESPKV